VDFIRTRDKMTTAHDEETAEVVRSEDHTQSEPIQHLHVGIHIGVPTVHAGHADGTQPLDEAPLSRPPELDEPAMHEPSTHVPLAIAQSVHIPPPMPQAVSTFVWQSPLLSQQPVPHNMALQVLELPPLALPLPLVLDPLGLALPPLLVLDPLVLPLLVLDPLVLPLLVLVLLPVSPLLDPEESSLVSDECPPSVRFVQSPIPSTVEHPPVQHTAKKQVAPTAAVAIPLRERGLISRGLLRTSL
jgi:hypothetical protein